MPIFNNFSNIENGQVIVKNNGSFVGQQYTPYTYQQNKSLFPTIIVSGDQNRLSAIVSDTKNIVEDKTYRVGFYCNMVSSISNRYALFEIQIDGNYISSKEFYDVSGNGTLVSMSSLFFSTATKSNVDFNVYVSAEKSNQLITILDSIITIEEF